MGTIMRLSRGLLFLLSLAPISCATPVSTELESPRLAPRAGPYNLRILPVGDSITLGFGSSDHNGYRLGLRNLLVYFGNTVDFIGSMSDGDNNPDNQHEGFGGQRITGIQRAMQADGIVFQRPNLILIHAGTNDNWFETDDETYADAPARLARLLDYVVYACPDAVILVAQVIASKVNQTQTDYFNSFVPGLVDARRAKGFKFATVDHRNVGPDMLVDLLHPTDQGYQVMAQNWKAAIDALPTDWITPPL